MPAEWSDQDSNDRKNLENYAEKFKNKKSGEIAERLLNSNHQDIKNITFTCNKTNKDLNLMMCSPLGNDKILNNYVDLCLSGFCVAPEAGLRYLDCIENGDKNCDRRINPGSFSMFLSDKL